MIEDSKTKIRVGVLRGGVGPYYKTSLKEGGNIISHISTNLSDKYKPVDILIDQDGFWHINGFPIKHEDVLNEKIDILWNTSHPSLSKVFDNLSIPLIGTSSFDFSQKNSKEMLREHMKGIKVKMPRHLILPIYQEDIDGTREAYAIQKAKDVFEKFSSPWIVKSLTPDVCMGEHVANTFPELVDSIIDGLFHNHGIFVEELITGKSTSVHFVSGFREKDIYSFPIINFSVSEKKELASIAEKIHKHIGAGAYLKLDFILHPNKGTYLKDISFHPDLDNDSDFNQSCESVGAKNHHAVECILESVLTDVV